MSKLTNKELVELVNRLDSISLGIHQPDVACITLIGYPEDILALDAYLMWFREHQKMLEIEPYLPLW